MNHPGIPAVPGRKSCQNCLNAAGAGNLRRNYGLTKAQHAAMMADQQGRCAVCKKKRRLGVDHNHKTKTIRELLCHPCNASLGFLEENPRLIRALATYAEKWAGK